MTTQLCKTCKQLLGLDFFYNKETGLISKTRCYRCIVRQRKCSKAYLIKLRKRAEKAESFVELLDKMRTENNAMVELFKKLLIANSQLPMGKQLTIPKVLKDEVDTIMKK